MKCACVAGGDGIVDDHENLSSVTTMEGAEMHAEQDESFYNVRSLRLRYGLGWHEAERVLQRFGTCKKELDLLLAARGRTPRHRPKELATPEQRAPFGIG